MEKSDLSRIEILPTDVDGPQAGILTPEVRSGSSFAFAGAGTATIPAFLVVWVYTVEETKRKTFVSKVRAFEASGMGLPAGVTYHGTYSVSISGVAPDFEFRTLWGLDDLAKVKDLNDHIRAAPAALQDVLKQIAVVPAMRSEIMGLTKNSAPISGST